MQSSQTYDYLIKLLMLGNSNVGKTCIMRRFIDDSFSPFVISSIAIDFTIKTITIEGKIVKLQIWDTAGQERYQSMARFYYRGAMGIVLVYDITDMQSFCSIPKWVRDIEEYSASNVKKILIGNKCDNDKGRLVTFEEGKHLASKYNMGFYEMSAKKDVNVSKSFVTICQEIINSLPVEKEAAGNKLTDFEQANEDKWKCC